MYYQFKNKQTRFKDAINLVDTYMNPRIL